jgi:cold shock CspA family protein
MAAFFPQETEGDSMMVSGVIEQFDVTHEFGFIVRDGHEDEPAIFFHVSDFGETFVFPGEVQNGKRVVFEIEKDERGVRAKNLALVEAL